MTLQQYFKKNAASKTEMKSNFLNYALFLLFSLPTFYDTCRWEVKVQEGKTFSSQGVQTDQLLLA